MQRGDNRVPTIPRAAVAALAVFLCYLAVHPFLSAWVGSLTGAYTAAKIWKDLVVFLAAFAALIFTLIAPNVRATFWRSRLNIVLAAYAGLALVLFFATQAFRQQAGVAGMIFDLRFLALFLTVRVVLWQMSGGRLATSADKLASVIIALGVMVSVLGILQVTVLPPYFLATFGYDGVNTISPISTIDNRPDAVRAFATLRGPNELGAYLILPIVLALTRGLAGRRRELYGAALVVMAVGAYVSHSRSAWLGIAIAVIIVVFLTIKTKLTSRHYVSVATGIMIAIAALLALSLTIPAVRLVVFHSSQGDSSLTEGSTANHVAATKAGIVDALQHPFGRGPGQAGPASYYLPPGQARIAESYYVQIAQELGAVGLVLFITICGLVITKLGALPRGSLDTAVLASFVGLLVVAMLLHTWNDDPLSYTWWGMAAVIVAVKGADNGTKAYKKAKRAA